ncbi:MAG: delta-60 repeat domain-containing protein [Planctomycetota bacterium]
MSQRTPHSNSWLQSLNQWFQGTSKRKGYEEQETPAPAHVEFLENRQLLSATNSAAANEQNAANTASNTEQTANAAGSTSTTTTTHGVDANGNATTTITITTTTTDEDGNVTTSSTSTTTVDGETETPSTNIDSDQAIASAVQADGKIVLVGAVQMDTHGNYDFAVTRLNADGSLDTTFGDNGRKIISFDLGGTDADGYLSADLDVANCVAIQSDGKIVVGGYAQRDSTGNFDFAVVRLNTDGSLDTTFSSDGKAIVAFDYGGQGDDRATGVAIQADGMIVLVGTCQQNASGTGDIAMARLRTDGSLDTGFTGDGRKWIDLSGGGDDAGAAVAIQSDGSIVVVGYSTSESGENNFAIARVTPNGSLDYSFSGDGKKTVSFNLGGSDRATSVAIQADGSIVVAGSASAANGDSDFAIARVTKSGGMDTTFSGDGRKTVSYNLGANNVDEATGVAIQSDGSIVIAGYSQVSASGDFDFSVARLTSVGELDTLFASGGKKSIPFNMGGSDGDVANGMVMQPDGKIIVVGYATASDPSNTDFAIARLNGDGDFDTTFGSGGKKTIAFDVTETD